MIEHLVRESEGYDQWKTDYGPASVQHNFRMDEHGRLDIAPDLAGETKSKDITTHAFRQMCDKLGTVAHPGSSRALPATYLLACPPGLRQENVNHWIRKTESQWFARLYKNNVRAILSDRYSSIGITEVLKWVDEALQSSDHDSIELVKPVVTPDVLHLRVLFANVNVNGGEDAPYAVGGYFTNGEIGNRKMGVYPLVQRHSCTNSIIVPSGDFSWDHIHVGRRQLLRRTFIDSIFYVLEGAVDALDRLLGAQSKMDDFTGRLDDLVERKGWTIEMRDRILIGSEGHESLFGLVQGVSAMANTVDDPDEQADLQIEAGKLLV